MSDTCLISQYLTIYIEIQMTFSLTIESQLQNMFYTILEQLKLNQMEMHFKNNLLPITFVMCSMINLLTDLCVILFTGSSQRT